MTDRPAPSAPEQKDCVHGLWNCDACDWKWGRDRLWYKDGRRPVPAPSAPPERPGEADGEGNPRIYPCAECGTMRSAPEGGTTFTVCDECWDKTYPKPAPPADVAGPNDEEVIRDGKPAPKV